jgi:DNA-binding HxlR family transcriptional regulator
LLVISELSEAYNFVSMKKENSTNSINQKIINATCGTTVTLALISGRWKPNILWQLLEGKLRYGDIKKKIPNISERMLAMQLKEMEADGLVTRTVHAEVPPRVDYELTGLGQSMKPMLRSIDEWGDNYREAIKED